MRTDSYSRSESCAFAVRAIAIGVLAAAGGTLTGCGAGNLALPQKLDSLRVLAIQADQPELASTGGLVTLTPLVSDVKGEGRELSYSYEACIDPGVGLGADLSCDLDPTKQTGSGSFSPAAPRFTGNATAFSVLVPATLMLKRSTKDQFNGVDYLIIYRIRAADGESVTSYKRVAVTNRTARNSSNPVVSGIVSAGVTLTALPGELSRIAPVIGDGAEESYDLLLDDGRTVSLQEEITVSWFVSDGEIKSPRTQGASDNQWTPPETASSVARFAVAVVRDDRGGAAWTILGP